MSWKPPDPDVERWHGPILHVGELRRLLEGLPDHIQVVLGEQPEDWYYNVSFVHSPRPTEVDFDEVQTAWQCLTLWPGSFFDSRQI